MRPDRLPLVLTRTQILGLIAALIVGLGLAGAACVGGPTSDFPSSSDTKGDNGGPDGGRSNENGGGTTGGSGSGDSESNGGGTSGVNPGSMDAGIMSDMDAGTEDGGL